MMKKKLKNKRKKIKRDDDDNYDDGELDESILDAVNEYVENLEDNDNNDNNDDDDNNNNTIDNKKGKKIDKNARNSKIIGIHSSSSSSLLLISSSSSSLLLIGNIEVTVLDDRMNPLSLYKCSKAANDFAKSIITNKERIKHSTYQSKKRGLPAFR